MTGHPNHPKIAISKKLFYKLPFIGLFLERAKWDVWDASFDIVPITTQTVTVASAIVLGSGNPIGLTYFN